MASTLHLYLIEPARNCYRYYTLSVQPGLFEEWSLRRAWGRMGTKGCDKTLWFDSQLKAEQFYERKRREKLRRGYQPSLFPMAPYGQQQKLANDGEKLFPPPLAALVSTARPTTPQQQELFKL
jgi:predicted DNA-binding WGR domain protein